MNTNFEHTRLQRRSSTMLQDVRPRDPRPHDRTRRLNGSDAATLTHGPAERVGVKPLGHRVPPGGPKRPPAPTDARDVPVAGKSDADEGGPLAGKRRTQLPPPPPSINSAAPPTG